jgi:hypothetical protein
VSATESGLRCERVMYFSDMLKRVQCQTSVFGGHIAGGSNELGDFWSEVDIFDIAEYVHESDGGTGERRCL